MQNEALLRLTVFLALFALFAGLEAWIPRRRLREPRPRRWFTNLSLVILDSFVLRTLALALPLLAVGAALDAERMGWGLFNHLSGPLWLEGMLSILLLDFAVWAQHLITHKVPVFWRFHRVHHADRDFDVTTALRFHPVEILASMLLKIGLAYLLGPQAVFVVLFEMILNGTAMFNHSNLRLPLGVDRLLRLVLVTPDMHRVHHSIHRHEHDSNYGFALSVWDRIFRTYRPMPEAGHDNMVVGLEWQDDKPSRLGWALILPFRK